MKHTARFGVIGITIQVISVTGGIGFQGYSLIPESVAL